MPIISKKVECQLAQQYRCHSMTEGHSSQHSRSLSLQARNQHCHIAILSDNLFSAFLERDYEGKTSMVRVGKSRDSYSRN